MTPDAAYVSRLSDVELLAKLIGVQESRRRYRGTLKSVFSPSSDEEEPVEICVVAKELVRRWLDEELRRECTLNSPGSVRDYLRLMFAGQEYESFVVLFLDAQNRLIASKEMFRGTLTQTSVYPREIVKESLRCNAAAVIFSHNHPSGVPEPSRADEQLTSSLKQALLLVDVKVLDHFIVAGSTTLSFAERGLM